MYSDTYRDQFSLLLKILPCLKEIDDFVLKGGTAINLFYRDLPRLSVDIDLTYTHICSRDETIKNINNSLVSLSNQIEKRLPNVKVKYRYSQNNEYILKLSIFDEKSIVKIEPNFIFRGTVHQPEYLTLSPLVIDEFGHYIDDIPVASFYDVFAGKICAALDRQHPRDLFDVKLLLENEGVSDMLRKTFIVYLACAPRPMHELLNPNRLDISLPYANQFQDMPTIPVSLEELISTRETLIQTLKGTLTEAEKKFLYSIKSGNPDYSMLPFENLEKLPALRWKVMNVNKMDKKRHAVMLKNLENVLYP